MNIYIEKGSFFKTARNIKKCYQFYRNKEEMHFHLIVQKRLSLVEAFLYFGGRKIRDVEFIIHYKALSRILLNLLNQKSGSMASILFVDKPLSEKEWKRVQKLNGMIRIIDTTDSNFENFYSGNRYVLCKNEHVNQFEEADEFQIACGGMGIYQCKHTSCLGRNLYVAKDGTISFCPVYAKQTKTGTVDDMEHVFESETFVNALKEMIAKRGECKKKCDYFEGCKGGCLFEENCVAFCERQSTLQREIDEIIENKKELNQLPFAKEIAILHKLLRVKK